MTDKLTPQEIAAYLPTYLRSADIIVLDRTDSTNTRLRELASQGARHASLLCASEQSSGRGRHGRDFFSPPGGVYMSVLLRSYPDTLPLTVYAAVAVRRVLDSLTNNEARIKWVNDILVGSRKVCGILAEAVPGGAIVGIGVNLSTEGLPRELEDIAGAVSTDRPRAGLIADIFASLLHVLELPADEVIGEYRRFSMLIGRRVRFERGGERSGIVTDILSDGGLLVACENGGVELRSGEVSVQFR